MNHSNAVRQAILDEVSSHYADEQPRRECAATILFVRRNPEYRYAKHHELLTLLMGRQPWTVENLERLYFYLRDETNVLL